MPASRVSFRLLRYHAFVAAGLVAALGIAGFVGVREMLAPGEEDTALLAAIVLLLIPSAAGVIAFLWRHHTAVLERAEFEGARALQAHARHLELLSEHANDVVLMVDHTGRIVRANDRVRDYHGHSPADLVGLDVSALRAPGHELDLREHIDRIRQEGHLRYETVHRRRDGTTFPVEISARGFEANGQWFFQAIVRDITERKEALRAMTYQAELLRNLHEAVIGLDERHVIRSWNTAAERIYGLRAEEVIGEPISEVLPSEYKGYTYEEFQEALERNDRMNFEVRRKLRTGSWVEIEAAAVVLRGEDGRVTGYVSLNRDVTLRKRAESALRASQERLARILETSSEGIWIVDVQGKTEFVNERGARLFGVTPAMALGRPQLDFVAEVARPYARADFEAALRGETVKREFSIRRNRSDDWIVVSWSALHDADGRVAGAVGVFMDVTEHRRAREQLLQAQKMDAVGRLASGVAHDFNNLLVSILSCSGFLLENLDEGDPRREEAAEIKKAGERAARLVKQLLAFGRKSAFRPVAVDVNPIVRQIETILRRAIGEEVALTVSLAASWPTRIDPGQLEQVLMNLAVNARDAMPQGGQLSIATRDVMLERPPPQAERLKPGRHAMLTVTDTGCGMLPEVVPRIFEPFFTTKPEGRGTGLGLSTVYGIVEEAGGAVTVTSAPGRGTSFSIYLPACAEDEVAATALPPVQARQPGRGETVLVVEDEEQVRRVARRILEAHGFRVLDAGSGAEALRRVQEEAVDVVLTDIVMPQMSGTELAAAVEALKPELPVVLMSGYSDSPPKSRATCVLQKPFSEDALLAVLDEALGRALEAQRRTA